MIVFNKHLLSPYYVSGTVLSATNSAFGFRGGVLAGNLMKRLVWDFLPPTTIYGLLPYDPAASSVGTLQTRNSAAGTSNKGCGTNSTQTVFHSSSWSLKLA